MKSGEKGLIGPGSNNYSRDEHLMEKIYNSVQKKMQEEEVAKKYVLHTLKQAKAQMGKVRKKAGYQSDDTQSAINACMEILTKQIKWITDNW
jgi:hypothetical protein